MAGESSVIRQMLLNTRSRLDYTNYAIFVGTYPNDLLEPNPLHLHRQVVRICAHENRVVV